MMSAQIGCLLCFAATAGILLVIVLVPMSFSYVEYYEYGLKQRKTTGAVDTSQVYTRGRYALGPDYRFIKYPADAQLVHLDDLEVFSAGQSNESIGLAFKVDVDYTFLLNEDEIGLVHRELASSYRDVIVSRTKDAIKNEAIFVTFHQYFQERTAVETRFRRAVQERWEASPPLHCTLDQFHLGRIKIPESVVSKQMESRIQNERNDRETFRQEATLERQKTAVDVNSINLEEDKVLRTAKAEADLLRARAKVEARELLANAEMNGTSLLVESAGITTQEQMTAFTYMRTLTNRGGALDLSVTYLSDDNVLKTRPV